MTRVSHVLREYQDVGAMSALVPLYGFVEDGVFLTKSGEVGMVLESAASITSVSTPPNAKPSRSASRSRSVCGMNTRGCRNTC